MADAPRQSKPGLPESLRGKHVCFSGTGGDRVELALLRALHEAGLRLSAIVEPESPAEALCRELEIPYTPHTFKHRFDRKAIALYRQLLETQPIDLLHCVSNRALSTAVIATRSMENPPKIVAYRGTMGHLSRFDPTSWFTYLSPRVDAIICVSDAVRRYLKTFRIPDERLRVIWKGHRPEWYAVQPASRAAFAEFGVPENAVVACMVGNLRPVKGAIHLIRAFDEIRPEENIHLLFIGDVRDKQVAREIGKHPCIHFIGFRGNAPQLAGACDFTLMTSIEREGLPRSIVEAMAQGIPPIVTDVGGMPELVENGVSGIIVPPKNPAALRDAIRTLAASPELRRQYGAAAKARIEGPFHFVHTAEKIITLYQDLLA